ncbi:phosphate ABC transporter permease subunit PstC [Tissierella sp. MB52-C2]|uniref:phosphate ABC transporter permease subunit PstC n=1 Tax=Tissierella sp. MB52-C2 TaxID=3070999 RepID=UPI00280AFF39|nr:phosphate ABC transporter permease subunit PstC [Tissierella sp. MB52-C2]WMM23597.1 phosphate ABC transporter permease subunit PstC [Tissierella sp. MB52-C2]
MKRLENSIFKGIVSFLTLFSVLILSFIIFFILKESTVFFKEVSITNFIFGKRWNPLGPADKLAIFPIILGTIYVSIIGIIIALPIGIGNAIVLSSYTNGKVKRIIRSIVDVLAGIPSVIYGFIGLLVLVKFLEIKFEFPTGESVLAGGIVLSIMMLPFIISTCEESMEKVYNEYSAYSNALGVSKGYMIRNIVLPNSKRSILASIVLALGRGMGETMAVMMVIGNAPIMPKLLGKCQTIPSLIALEMGMAEVGSLHYHGLYASGFVLMMILLIINVILYIIKRKLI